MIITDKLTTNKVIRAVKRDDNSGFCVTCAKVHKYCEPDAREYPCTKCKTNTVYGAEELLLHLVA